MFTYNDLFMNRLTKGAAVLALAVSAFSPSASFAADANADLEAYVNIPHMCSIDAGYELDLTPYVSPGQNNVRRGVEGALNVAQNGSTRWSLDSVQVLSQPVDSQLNWASGIRVNFRNDGSQAGSNGGSNLPDQLQANVADNGTREYDLHGAFASPVAMGANIDEDAQLYSPLTQSNVAAPLLGGEEYRLATTLRCTALQVPQ